MKSVLRNIVFSLLLVLVTSWHISAQNEVFEALNSTLKSNEVKDIAQYFDQIVDITINNNENTYSKTQASAVIDNYIKKNKVLKHQILHSGTFNDSSRLFIVSEITTNNNKRYKIFLRLKRQGDTDNYLVQTIRIY